MMGQNNKGSFNWWWVVLAMIIFGFGSAIMHDQTELIDNAVPEEESHEENSLDEPDWALAVVDGEHTSNVCRFANTELFNETVTIVYPDFNPDDNVVGRWNPTTNTIELMQPDGLTIKTVAHEVSHMVDTFMYKYAPLDPHYEAYMQGFWTWCVYEVMMHDIEEAKEPKFKFVE